MGNSDWGHCLVKFYNNWMQQLLKILICTINLLKWNKTKRERSLVNISYNLHHRHKLNNKEMYLLDWMSECLAHWKDKIDRMAQLVEGQTEKPGAMLTIYVWFPSGSVTRDFTPPHQLSVQTLLQCLYNTPVQCMLKILNTGTTVWIQKYSTHW